MTLKQNTLKNILILFLLFISNLLYSQLFFPTPIGAYKKYEKGEFDKAEADFKKILKKDAASVICIHGLAKIYADKSFKSFNLDTAYLYSDKSQSFINGSNDLEWSPNLTKKELNDIEKLELTPQNLRDFKDSILKRLFDDALSKNSITSYKNFIDKYPKAPQVSNAWINIHILAFNEASKDNTIDSYQNFINNYPEAKQVNEAKIRIYDIAYSKASEINSIEGYQNFINSYPNASQVNEAKSKIHFLAYSEASGLNTVEAFQNFIKSYPDANQIKEAKNNIYSLAYANSVKINTMEAYKQFMTDYPDAPQSIQSLKNIHKIAFEDAKQQNTMIAYFQYNQFAQI